MDKLHKKMALEEEKRKHRMKAAVLKTNTEELCQRITNGSEAIFAEHLKSKRTRRGQDERKKQGNHKRKESFS